MIEAIRGKHGDPKKEAGDVLLVLMSITEYAGISWADVVAEVERNTSDLMTRPPYQGEERETPAPPVQPASGEGER